MADAQPSLATDSTRLISLTILQRAAGLFNGILYLALLPPVAYAAWKTAATFLQIGLPGWSLLQTDLAKRRRQGDTDWVATWKGMLLVAVTCGLALFITTWLALSFVLKIYSSLRGYEMVLMVGTGLFLTSPIKTCLTLWWQVTSRFDLYSKLTTLETLVYTTGLLVGFFIFHEGVLVIPVAILISHGVHIVCSGWIWSRGLKREGTGRRLALGDLGAIWQLARREGKWVVLREASWDWYEALKVAVLNMLFPAALLGQLFAAETLATYANTFFVALQPLFQVRLSDGKDREGLRSMGEKFIPLLVTMAWGLYVLTMPAFYLVSHLLFNQYVEAMLLYPFFALQLPWNAVSLVVMPQLYALGQQPKLLRYSLERNALELSTILLGTIVLGPVAAPVILGHLIGGYFFTVRRAVLADRLLESRQARVRTFFPSRAALVEVVQRLRLRYGSGRV